MSRPTGLPMREAVVFLWFNLYGLTGDASPVRLCSWAVDSADSIPIGDCEPRILELQLQSRQDCREVISARPYAKISTGFVRLHSHKDPFDTHSFAITLSAGNTVRKVHPGTSEPIHVSV